ncbi:DUF2807 domain-containing protein [Mangrovivirga sp. M17]|uniref:DUF2807 domain-containing protein n=1 Tax=Mangrovivirga halotolerans TaxID=2993936 RepID=A0ABT3RRD6_9BACT|nr:head GIN domain-containing protein [Mangrovivirga halotolerans]MCX2744132.1 DUF2807 domain-containing protein [Mangrovivirga halotolerans]
MKSSYGIWKTLYLALLCLIVVSSCKDDDLCLTGSGNVIDYPLELGNFNSVALSGPINLELTQGAEQSVTISAEPEMYGPLYHKVNGNTLLVGYEDNVRCFNTNHGVWVNVVVPDISSIEAEGKSNIVSEGDLTLDQMNISNSGEAYINMSGTIDTQIINVDGKMTMKNFKVESKNIIINVVGSGDFEITCTEKLTINVEGSATVIYKGQPEIEQSSEGSLNLIDGN